MENLEQFVRDIGQQKGLTLNRKIGRWMRENTSEADDLVRYYDATTKDIVAKHLTTKRGKLRHLFDNSKGRSGVFARLRRHPLLFGLAGSLAAGFGTDSYLTHRIIEHTPEQVEYALKQTELEKDTEQLKTLFNNDMQEMTSEGAVCLTQDREGGCSVEHVPTLNALVPDKFVPEYFADKLDRTVFRVPFWQIPFLAKGKDIVSTGHLHTYGESVSKEDKLVTQQQRGREEVVIVNGIIPSRYVVADGHERFVPYGRQGLESKVSDDLKLILGEAVIPRYDKLDSSQITDNQRLEHFASLAGILDAKGYDVNNVNSLVEGYLNSAEEFINKSDLEIQYSDNYTQRIQSLQSTLNSLLGLETFISDEGVRNRIPGLKTKFECDKNNTRMTKVIKDNPDFDFDSDIKIRPINIDPIRLSFDDEASLRTQNSKTWVNGDGSYVTEIGHMHQKGSDDLLKDVNTNINQCNGFLQSNGPFYSCSLRDGEFDVSSGKNTSLFVVPNFKINTQSENTVRYVSNVGRLDISFGIGEFLIDTVFPTKECFDRYKLTDFKLPGFNKSSALYDSHGLILERISNGKELKPEVDISPPYHLRQHFIYTPNKSDFEYISNFVFQKSGFLGYALTKDGKDISIGSKFSRPLKTMRGVIAFNTSPIPSVSSVSNLELILNFKEVSTPTLLILDPPQEINGDYNNAREGYEMLSPKKTNTLSRCEITDKTDIPMRFNLGPMGLSKFNDVLINSKSFSVGLVLENEKDRDVYADVVFLDCQHPTKTPKLRVTYTLPEGVEHPGYERYREMMKKAGEGK
ncbi:MAG: hypothetical protein WC533_03265 [Candidatus Pacearchaeota archaeon]